MDGGAWWGYSPWGPRAGYNLVTKQQDNVLFYQHFKVYWEQKWNFTPVGMFHHALHKASPCWLRKETLKVQFNVALVVCRGYYENYDIVYY